MQQVMRGGFAALVGLSLFTPAVLAKIAAPPPVPDRIARADCVLLGKVASIEDKTVMTKEGAEFSIAIVKIEEGLLGTKGAKEVKVGFHRGENRRFPLLNLKPGQESYFILSKQPGQDFYIIANFADVVARDGKNAFFGTPDLVRRCAKLLADPDKGLAGKDDDRFLTAAMLIKRYRTPRERNKTNPISPRRSKAILEALAAADWANPDPELRQSPQGLFMQLGVGEKDGWRPPTDFQQIPAAAKKWLKDNAASYRIQSFVTDDDPSK
ncbi:MAG TPA: hypothetical protein VKE94_02690 [Gemmataceae bacterium]|nr:hypothetical protein [Gemmataceae bacterium]